MNFVAIDVETANPDLTSICQIGAARFQNGSVTERWSTYVNPATWFDPYQVEKHGIDDSIVSGAPRFEDLLPQLRDLLEGRTVVSHMPFDRTAISRSCQRNGTEMPDCTWIDSARVFRRTFEQFARRGYGLKNACDHIGHTFRHHDALEDAIASGRVLLACARETNLTLSELHIFSLRTRDSSSSSIEVEANRDGDLYGEIVVFTGALSITRREAAALAAEAGCSVASSVSKKTTLLVVGDQDTERLAGHDRSAKHRRADELRAQGHPIHILRESDFRAMLA